MEPIPKSGYYYANKIVVITLKALEDVMGKNGVNAILNLAHLPHLIDHYPNDNLAKEFDFADFTAINMALEEMYGPRGGRGLALRAGRAAFADSLRNFGALAGASDLAFKVLPLQTKLRIGIRCILLINESHCHAFLQRRRNEHAGFCKMLQVVRAAVRQGPQVNGEYDVKASHAEQSVRLHRMESDLLRLNKRAAVVADSLHFHGKFGVCRNLEGFSALNQLP